MILAIDFPVIETDVHDTEIRAYRNVDVDSTLAPAERDHVLRGLVRNMDASNRPITVTYQTRLCSAVFTMANRPSSRGCDGFPISRSSWAHSLC